MKNSLTLLEAAHKLLHNKMHEEEDFHSQRMISNQLSSLIRNASELKEMIDNDAEFPEWAQSEIAVAQSNIADVTNFMISNSEEKLDEARGYKSLTPAALIDELQSVIDLPDNKLTDVTNISFRVSREEIHKRYPEIYKLLEKMYDAVMKPNGAKETKKIAQKAIEIVRSKYPNADKYQRMAQIKEKYRIGAGHKDAVASLMKCERYFSPNSNLAKNIIDEFGEGYKKDFTEMEKYIAKVISLWEGIEMEIAMEN
jgi:hypothetical protein